MEERFEVQTPLGPVWFWGRNTGRPTLLIITGTFAPANYFWRLQELLPDADVIRAHLPGNHSPPLTSTSINGFISAFDHAIATLVANRTIAVVGVSVGGIVALGLRAPQITRLVVVDPPLRTNLLWPLRSFREQAAGDWEAFTWPILGIGAHCTEARDYLHLIDGLHRPTVVLLAGEPLLPVRQMVGWPTLVDDDVRRALEQHPLIEVVEARGASHNIPRDAPEVFFRAVERALSG